MLSTASFAWRSVLVFTLCLWRDTCHLSTEKKKKRCSVLVFTALAKVANACFVKTKSLRSYSTVLFFCFVLFFISQTFIHGRKCSVRTRRLPLTQCFRENLIYCVERQADQFRNLDFRSKMQQEARLIVLETKTARDKASSLR